MLEKLKITNSDQKGFFKEAVGVAEQAANAAFDVEKLKLAASHVVEDKMADARRMIKKGRYAAEDLVDDTAHRIKHEPFRSVGIACGVGFGLGIFAGWLVTSRFKRH